MNDAKYQKQLNRALEWCQKNENANTNMSRLVYVGSQKFRVDEMDLMYEYRVAKGAMEYAV